MEMKNAVDGLLDTPRKESLSLKTVETYKIQVQREKKHEKTQNRIFKNSGESYNKKCTIQVMGISSKRRKGTEAIF